ncbi:MAG: Rieske (2Fe-2S) protein, partial [Acidimicrobiales bacterium]|nr:Rieske (2Fe-2S) protein [Acidimicrobiales bacterium]
MEHVEQVAQIKTMLARLDSGITVDAGGFRRNPAWVYTDPELAERERAAFFAGHPQLIGLSGDLPGPGSFLTTFDLDTPILATRGQDGNFRAFVNSCRHRGVVLEERERGSERRFACRFHQWTYADDGTLVGLPKEEHFGDVDRSCLGLFELPSVEQDGLLWVHPDPAGSIDLEEQLGTDLCA